MKKLFKSWKNTPYFFVAILVLGFVLRFVNLTKLPIFADEAIYVRWAQVMANEPTLRFLPLSDGKQPLYMWVLMFLINFFKNPLFIGRLASVFTGLGTMVGIFVLSLLLFKKKKVALLSTLLYALSPFAVFFDRMALVDSMLSMFGIWTAVFAYLSFKQKRLDLAMIAGIVLGFASLTKSPAIFIAVLLPVFWLIVKWNKKLPIYLGVIYLIAFGMYNIQRLGPGFQMLSLRTADYVYPISHLWTNTFDPLIPHLKDVVVWFWSMGPAAIIGLWLLGNLALWKKSKKKLLVLNIFFLAPVVFQSGIAKAFTARYIFYTLPYFYILAGVALLNKRKPGKIFYYIFFGLFVVQSLIFNFYLLTDPEKADLPRGERSGYLEEWTAGQGIKEIADYLKTESKNLGEGEKFVVGTEGYFGTLPDGLQIYVDGDPKILVVGTGLNFLTVPEPLIESFEAGNRTFLVVNKSRFQGNYEKLGFKLIKSYPKALRLTDSDQYAKYGPQDDLYLLELMEIKTTGDDTI